jgi:hypothetical protein
MVVSLTDYQNLVSNQDQPRELWDWTAAFNALMRHNDIVVLIPPGSYFMRYPEKINKTKHISGFGATLNMYGIIQIHADDCDIVGVTFDGTGSGIRSTEHAMILENANNIRIDRCTFRNVRKNGIQFSNNGRCSWVWIEKCHFENIGYNVLDPSAQGIGISIQNADHVRIRDCDLGDTYGQGAIQAVRTYDLLIADSEINRTAYRGINIYGNNVDPYDFIRDVQITNVKIRYCGHHNFTPKGMATNGIFVRNPAGKVEDVKIRDCTIEYVGENCLEGSFEAYNNTLRYSGYYDRFSTVSKELVYLHSGAIFTHNKLAFGKEEGVKMYDSRRDIIVQGNMIWDCGMAEIYVHANGEGQVIENVSLLNNIILHRERINIKPIEIIANNGGIVRNITSENSLVKI